MWIEQISNPINLCDQIEISSLWSPCLGIHVNQIMDKSINRFRSNYSNYESRIGHIYLDEVDPGDRVLRKLILINCGQFRLNFASKLDILKPNRRQSKSSLGLTKSQLMLAKQLLEGCPDQGLDPSLSIEPKLGVVEPGESITCQLEFKPPKNLHLFFINHVRLDSLIGLFVAIQDGPFYAVQLNGWTKTQPVGFSPSSIDFGTQLMIQPGIQNPIRYLNIFNKNFINSVSIECVSQSSNVFQFEMEPVILPPNKNEKNIDLHSLPNPNILSIPIKFNPTENRHYKETILFELNGCSLISVDLSGQGCPIQLEAQPGPLLIGQSNQMKKFYLAKIKKDHFVETNQCINMGILKSNQQSRRFVSIINRSLAPICLHQIRFSQNNLQQPDNCQIKQSKLSLIKVQVCQPIPIENQPMIVGSLANQELPVILRENGGQAMIEILFNSIYRMPEFVEEVIAEISGLDHHHVNETQKFSYKDQTHLFWSLFSIRGIVQTYEIEFDTSYISFGSIACGSQLTKTVILVNSGDLGAKLV